MKHVITLSLLAVFVIAASFTFMPNKPWPVPDKDAKKANPVKTDAASVSAGKALWSTHCSSCHGKTGLGDGNKAAQLKTQPEDRLDALKEMLEKEVKEHDYRQT